MTGFTFWLVGEIKYSVFVETVVAVFGKLTFFIYSVVPFKKLKRFIFFGVLTVFLFNDVSFLLFAFSIFLPSVIEFELSRSDLVLFLSIF